MNGGVFKNFLDMPAPPGYIPGLGRGATGFTTRSDIGPARSGAADKAFQANEDEDPERFQDAEEEGDNEDQNRDQDNENDEGLLAKGNFDLEDDEADEIFAKIDLRMSERHKSKREEREKREEEELKNNTVSISDQFTDLKRALSSVSTDEWANLPEAGDLTKKNKRQRLNEQAERRFYAVPDSILRGASSSMEVSGTVQDEQDEADDGTATDFRGISSARDKMLGMRLDQLTGNSGKNTSSFDSKGYLTSLSTQPSVAIDMGDVKRVRPLLESLVKTEPKEARGWIGLCRLEEIANRKSKARTIIAQGCENCPKNEDLWLENMRINNKHDAKIVAARAVRFIPNSVKVWKAASDLEDDTISKKKVIQKALEANPNSDTLWRAAVNLEEDPEEAKLLLSQAVELSPLSEDLWLAYARLEQPDKARKILNKARKALRTSRAIWIAAARLEEQDKGDQKRVEDIFARGIRELEKEGALPNRAQWLTEAENCENDDALLTCHAIIKCTLGQGLEEESAKDRESIWLEDAKVTAEHGNFNTARAIFSYVLREFPTSANAWLATVDTERRHGTKESLYETLDKATRSCPHLEEFWLLFSKEKAISGDLHGAREVLARAFDANPNSEKIWLAAFQLEAGDKNYDRALKLLARARQVTDSAQLWIKAVILERQLGKLDEALVLINDGLKKFPDEPEFHILKGQIFEQLQDDKQAKAAYENGTQVCPHYVKLWILHARLEEKTGVVIRARIILDRAALANKKNELIWLEMILLEKRQSNVRQATILVTKALQECPKSGLLWSQLIWLQNRLQRKGKIIDAVKACENDAYVLITVARDMWMNGKPKAKTWFERAIKSNPKNGDAWLWFYHYLQDTKQTAELDQVTEQFLLAEPDEGLEWETLRDSPAAFEKSTKQVFIEGASALKESHVY